MSIKKKMFVFLFAIIAGSILLISSKDIAAPQHKTEKVISNERFFK